MAFNVKKMIRPCCAELEPYKAGKPVETVRRELGLKRVIKLASNENPLGPSPRALAAIRKAAAKVYFYPDSNSWSLKQTIAKKFGVRPENILLGTGSDEIIALIGKAFLQPKDEVVISEHSFIQYKCAAAVSGCKVISVPMKKLAHDLSAMAKAVTPRTKAVFIANPNNPTGTYNTKQEVESFLKAVSSRNNPPIVVMDEAYYEYARMKSDYPETLGYLARYPNLIILRTFSKVYGLAGLRVGYGFASAEVVDYFDRIRPPFNINLLAQVAAVESLKDKAQVKKGTELIKKQGSLLLKELVKMGIPYVPSAANFVLIDVYPMLGRDVFQKMLRKGVIVRDMDEYNMPNHVRVTIGLPQENRMFIRAFKEVMA